MLRRGAKLYYRHVVPSDVQRLTRCEQIRRSVKSDSLTVAPRRVPNIIARVEAEIGYIPAKAGLTFDAALLRPFEKYSGDTDAARVDAGIYLRRPPGYGLAYTIGKVQTHALLAGRLVMDQRDGRAEYTMPEIPRMAAAERRWCPPHTVIEVPR